MVNTTNIDSLWSPQQGSFEVLSGPIESVETRYLNAQLQKCYRVSYTLRARSHGHFPITGPVVFHNGGQKLGGNDRFLRVLPRTGIRFIVTHDPTVTQH